MTAISARASSTVENDDDATLMDYLRLYGYLLRQPNGYRWLAGYLKGDALQFARRVIEARYPATVPALLLVPHARERKPTPVRRNRAA